MDGPLSAPGRALNSSTEQIDWRMLLLRPKRSEKCALKHGASMRQFRFHIASSAGKTGFILPPFSYRQPGLASGRRPRRARGSAPAASGCLPIFRLGLFCLGFRLGLHFSNDVVHLLVGLGANASRPVHLGCSSSHAPLPLVSLT